VLREHLEDLTQLSDILIERETIDRDQFERLLAGESEEEAFGESKAETPALPEPEAERKRLPKPKPKPFPMPGQAMQPPPPEPSGS
jgi:cell division protease FtsH